MALPLSRRGARRNFQGFVPEEFAAMVPMSEEQCRVVFMSAALLLDYPDDHTAVTAREAVTEQLGDLPEEISVQFRSFLDYAADCRGNGVRGEFELQEHYVSTFDQQRKCSLFLSYYAVGDTRQRGTAILAFAQQLEEIGFTLIREELPDHLCVLLEAAAQAHGDAYRIATEMLAAHRDGLEVLRSALVDLESPYAGVVSAVCSALPPVSAETAENYRNLVRSGPPAELVGLGTPLPSTGSENLS